MRTDFDVWRETPASRLWKLDRLILSLELGHVCGPAGAPVPRPGIYVVKPCVNALGMARGAFFAELTSSTDHLPPGSFWCERFTGRHLSTDYLAGRPVLCVEGTPSPRFGRWLGWRRVDLSEAPTCPTCLLEEPGRVNAETIGGRVIEVHLRPNPDFRWRNSVAIPVYEGDAIHQLRGLRFVTDRDADRVGFLVDAGVSLDQASR